MTRISILRAALTAVALAAIAVQTRADAITDWNTKAGDFVQEVSNARVWEGVHYRFSTDVGMAMGSQIGELAAAEHLPQP